VHNTRAIQKYSVLNAVPPFSLDSNMPDESLVPGPAVREQEIRTTPRTVDGFGRCGKRQWKVFKICFRPTTVPISELSD